MNYTTLVESLHQGTLWGSLMAGWIFSRTKQKFENGVSDEKRTLVEEKENYMFGKPTIHPHNIIPIINYAWK